MPPDFMRSGGGLPRSHALAPKVWSRHAQIPRRRPEGRQSPLVPAGPVTLLRGSRWLLVLAGALLLAAVAGAWRGSTRVAFDVASTVPSRMQVFHDRRGAFSERRSDWLAMGTGTPAPARLRIPAGRALWLRLDPAVATTTTVCGWRVDGEPAGFEVVASAGLDVRREGGCLRLRAEASATDPQVVVRATGTASDRIRAARPWHRAGRLALALLIPVVGVLAWRHRRPLGALARTLPPPRGWRRVEPQLHHVVMALMLVFGGLFVFVTPPGAVPDEQAHFAKIVRVAWGEPLGGHRDMALPDTMAAFHPFDDFAGTRRAFTDGELRTQLARRLRCVPDRSTGLHGADGYAPHQYAIAALVFHAACTAGSSFGQFVHVARGLNLAIAILLVGWGVQFAGRGKLALAFVALLPMSLFQMASLSADSLVISLSLAWLGLVSGIASGTRPYRRVDVGLLLLAIAIAFLKPGSAWILVAIVFCKQRLDRERGFWQALALYMALPMLVHAVFTLAMAGNAPGLDKVDPVANRHMLFAQPAHVLAVLWASVAQFGEWMVHAMVGVLGWLDIPLARSAYLLTYLLALAALFANAPEPQPVPALVRPLAAACGVGAFVLLALPIFVYWTPTGATLITGLQGRYFLPLAAFVLAWLSTSSPAGPRGWLALLVLAGVALVDAHALARVHEAYFVTGR
jgi:hypothetical protein